MSRRNFKLLRLAAVVVFVVIFSGCAQLGKKPDLPPEEAVRLRAQAWADALMAGDLQGAYALTSPNYRQFSSAGLYNVFVAGSSNWTSAVVDSVQCEGEVCDIRVMVEYEIKRYNMTNRRPLPYKWVRVNGEWWLYVPAK